MDLNQMIAALERYRNHSGGTTEILVSMKEEEFSPLFNTFEFYSGADHCSYVVIVPEEVNLRKVQENIKDE